MLLVPSNKTASHTPVSCTTTSTSLLKQGASSSFYARLDIGNRSHEWPTSIYQGSADKEKTDISNVICRWFMAYAAHRGTSHAEKLLHKPRPDFAALSAFFLEECNVKRKLATWLHSSYSHTLLQTGLLPIQSEDWKGRLGSRHTATAMGEDIFLEIMQKIPMDE